MSRFFESSVRNGVREGYLRVEIQIQEAGIYGRSFLGKDWERGKNYSREKL